MVTLKDGTVSVKEEFAGAEFGDVRLRKRLSGVAEAMASDPGSGLPGALGSSAALEGAYRFLRNERVRPEEILRPHIQATAERIQKAGEVLLIHDTSIFCFTGEKSREGLCKITRDKQGFYGHFALAVSATNATPLGVTGLRTFIRSRDKGCRPSSKIFNDPNRESRRWLELVQHAEERLCESARLIHVMDRQADFYELFDELITRNRRFAIRICHDRLLLDGGMDGTMFEKLEKAKGVLKREVPLSARKASRVLGNRRANPPRGYRTALLVFSACSVEVKAPRHLRKHCSPSLKFNVVHVREQRPPKGEDPIDWKIASSDSIETAEDIARIVDNYRKRWTIEEYFKCLKTGCSFEQRQLESSTTLLNILAISIPIAWKLLVLRGLSREGNTRDEPTLTPTQLSILRVFTKLSLPPNPTAREGMLAVAALGGHIKNNGDPGWMVLWRGYKKLLDYELAWNAALAERCDQS